MFICSILSKILPKRGTEKTCSFYADVRSCMSTVCFLTSWPPFKQLPTILTVDHHFNSWPQFKQLTNIKTVNHQLNSWPQIKQLTNIKTVNHH